MTDEERRRNIGSKQYLTPNELAFMIGRDRSTIKRWIKFHGLPTHLVRGQRYVVRTELDDWYGKRHAGTAD